LDSFSKKEERVGMGWAEVQEFNGKGTMEKLEVFLITN